MAPDIRPVRIEKRQKRGPLAQRALHRPLQPTAKGVAQVPFALAISKADWTNPHETTAVNTRKKVLAATRVAVETRFLCRPCLPPKRGLKGVGGYSMRGFGHSKPQGPIEVCRWVEGCFGSKPRNGHLVSFPFLVDFPHCVFHAGGLSLLRTSNTPNVPWTPTTVSARQIRIVTDITILR
jgi:hypothetical protein